MTAAVFHVVQLSEQGRIQMLLVGLHLPPLATMMFNAAFFLFTESLFVQLHFLVSHLVKAHHSASQPTEVFPVSKLQCTHSREFREKAGEDREISCPPIIFKKYFYTCCF